MKSQFPRILAVLLCCLAARQGYTQTADLIIRNGKIATMARAGEFVGAVAIKDGLILATGPEKQLVSAHKGPRTKVIDAKGRTVIPGLNDSHIHIIREGLNYNAELRWDGIRSLKEAMRMLSEQAKRTPPGVWIKVVGGWNEFQFEEKRQPTLAEINEAVPDKPVFISYLYGKAFLNRAGILALGYDKNTRYEGSLVELDGEGNPTGMLFAKETPKAIYTTLALTTRLSPEEQLNSTMHFYRELNRFGLTSAADAGGGGHSYPADYAAALQLAKAGKLTIRTSYFLFSQVKGTELRDYEKWLETTYPNHNDHLFLANGYAAEGAGENLVASAADFENFLEPRTILSDTMEADLEPVVRLLVKNRWPFRLHATYGESIERMLAVFEKVNADTPFNGLRWFFDHAETITDAQLQRVKKLGGGIAVQFRMYFQGELYQKLYGQPVRQLPPIRQMLSLRIPVGMGTDATRITSYNPWMAMHWLLTGKTIGGEQFWPEDQALDKFTSLQLFTAGSAWFTGEEHLKGKLVPGMYADLAILSDDYFSLPPDRVRDLESDLTIVNGKVVYASSSFPEYAVPAPPVIPEWSPIRHFGGYPRSK
ncbi:amidohydrolase [Dyadobacter fermentans]|uniref:Amidohydrolase 3 n=1 Tax=Dyadobacter fermentans (strain ATCC 700827 / DSM 18053 / CIP 107007 / KCTC 52180 / NS114) TaxID=471854 RepID=C6VVB8_DYAFD|nr:amidohydrolase [Dyadobacter fermentans]ACT96648.1 Amidohydrolase 3 [Dyadobacter fermentans DSM 18053]